jgi:hypothetical protein
MPSPITKLSYIEDRKMATDWTLEGQYFEACNCDAACPCVFLSQPTTGECTVIIGWHINSGVFGNTDLRGLNVIRAVYTPGHMQQVPWTAALYLDARADEAQNAALEQIFTGKVGGSPSKLAAHIETDLGIRKVPIEFSANGKKRTVSIPNIVDIEIAAIVGQGDGDVTISGHPLCVAPGHTIVASRSRYFRYADHGLNWELSEKTAFFSPFNYAGP